MPSDTLVATKSEHTDRLTVTPLPYSSGAEDYAIALSELEGFIWLDSGRPFLSHHLANRYDILSAQPKSSLKIDPFYRAFMDNKEVVYSDTLVKKFIHHHSQFSIENAQLLDLPFVGGVLGYFAYEYLHNNYNIDPPQALYTTPLVQLGAYDWSIIVDHEKQQTHLVSHPNKIEEILKLIQYKRKLPAFFCKPFLNDESKESYLHNTQKIKEHLLSGNCYQSNYSQRFSSRYHGCELSGFLKLRKANPAPFSAFIKTSQGAILSASPERFIKIEKDEAITQPIKGSAPRSDDKSEDQLNAHTLCNSDKNRAENLMIVDLMRNDFSKACKPHSVKTPKLFELQSFSNVHHLVSTVTGTLDATHCAADLFHYCFPGGSITGAPKRRAMQIIDELEHYQRHIYCGSIAYFSGNNKTDSNIAIRTFLLEDNNAYCWGGGGIVIDSELEGEFLESIYKIKKLMRSLVEPVNCSS